MSLADDLKELAHDVRAIPGELGIRPHTVSLLERDWDGTYSGDGDRTDVSTEITESGQPPKVRWLTDEELALAGLAKGEIEIGPITADHDAISRIADFRGDDMDAGEAHYLIITGPKHPSGAKYRITRITAERAIHYLIRARPVDLSS